MPHDVQTSLAQPENYVRWPTECLCLPRARLSTALDRLWKIGGEREQETDTGGGGKRQSSGMPARRRPRLIVFSRSAQYRGLPQVVYARNRASELKSGLILIASAREARASSSASVSPSAAASSM